MSERVTDSLLKELRDFDEQTPQGNRVKQTISWTQRRHELRMEVSHNGNEAANEEAMRLARGRAFVANLTRQEREIIKEMVSKKAKDAEAKLKRIGVADERWFAEQRADNQASDQ
jgi:hypothetical protein